MARTGSPWPGRVHHGPVHHGPVHPWYTHPGYTPATVLLYPRHAHAVSGDFKMCYGLKLDTA